MLLFIIIFFISTAALSSKKIMYDSYGRPYECCNYNGTLPVDDYTQEVRQDHSPQVWQGFENDPTNGFSDIAEQAEISGFERNVYNTQK